jgi:integrase
MALQVFIDQHDSYADQGAADALRLLILTGAREGEVLGATWEQFDLKRGTWTKPSHHTKQKRTEHTPLSTPAVDILKRMAKANNGPHLFPGRMGDHARVTLHRPWIQVCKAAGLASEYRISGKRRELIRWKPSFHVHDLRHTSASHLVSKGESLHIVGNLLGHTQPQTRRVMRIWPMLHCATLRIVLEASSEGSDAIVTTAPNAFFLLRLGDRAVDVPNGNI